jgi:purine-binding chemotaxis protein CheW
VCIVNSTPTKQPGEISTRDVLRRRAQLLAKPLETPASRRQSLEVLEFTLSRERYAFPASYVREVFRVTEITPLPGVPSYITGVINVRGRILSVMDMRRLLDFAHIGLSNLNKAIILQHGDMELAVLADEVTGVYRIDPQEWQRTLPTLSDKQAEFLQGVSTDQVVLLDAGKMLDSRDLIVGSEQQTRD